MKEVGEVIIKIITSCYLLCLYNFYILYAPLITFLSMSVKQYILFLASGTAIAVCAWFIVLISINPVTAGPFGFLAFYITLFVALIGIFATLATLVRMRRKKHPTVESMIKVSLRQGIFLAILVESALILLAKGYLTTVTLLIIIIVIAILEFLFLSIENAAHKRT